MWLNTSGQAASGLTLRHIYSSLCFFAAFSLLEERVRLFQLRKAIIQLKLFVTCQKPLRGIWRGVYSQFFNAPLGALKCFGVEQSPTPLTNNRDEDKRTYYSNARIFKSDGLDVFSGEVLVYILKVMVRSIHN